MNGRDKGCWIWRESGVYEIVLPLQLPGGQTPTLALRRPTYPRLVASRCWRLCHSGKNRSSATCCSWHWSPGNGPACRSVAAVSRCTSCGMSEHSDHSVTQETCLHVCLTCTDSDFSFLVKNNQKTLVSVWSPLSLCLWRCRPTGSPAHCRPRSLPNPASHPSLQTGTPSLWVRNDQHWAFCNHAPAKKVVVFPLTS